MDNDFFEFSSNFKDFLQPKPLILWIFDQFSIKNGQNGDFEGLKMLYIIKICKNIPSLSAAIWPSCNTVRGQSECSQQHVRYEPTPELWNDSHFSNWLEIRVREIVALLLGWRITWHHDIFEKVHGSISCVIWTHSLRSSIYLMKVRFYLSKIFTFYFHFNFH